MSLGIRWVWDVWWILSGDGTWVVGLVRVLGFWVDTRVKRRVLKEFDMKR